MDPIVIVVVVAIVVGAAAFVFLRKTPGDRELPKGEPRSPLPFGEAKPAKKEPEPRRAEPVKKTEADRPLGAPEARAAAGPAERPAAPAEAEPARPSRPSAEAIEALKQGLKTTRGGFIARLAKIFGSKAQIDPAILDEIEEVLIAADIGVKTTAKILGRLRERLEQNELADEERVWEALRTEALEILGGSPGGIRLGQKPTVILVVGVNGVGKTTTIGKLASRFKDQGKSVVLAAGDTFRAAAVLQLEVWGRRTGIPVVKGKERADPASVIYDAIKKARDDGADVVIADTAGRLHTKLPLIEEIKKVYRSCEKALDGRVPDEVLLVLDSTNGQNAIQQAQQFREALPVSGIALTKLDGTAKGGVILGIVEEHRIPVRYVGIGERVEDLREFEAASFVAALFAKPDDESMAA